VSGSVSEEVNKKGKIQTFRKLLISRIGVSVSASEVVKQKGEISNQILEDLGRDIPSNNFTEQEKNLVKELSNRI
jgi:hypothetical protein